MRNGLSRELVSVILTTTMKRIDYAQLVSSAEQLQRDDPQSLIRLQAICKEFDVGMRTLHFAFQSERGMPPAFCLRAIRLDCARKSLLSSRSQKLLVKSVAIENGFTHMGEFSKRYKARFGELPSVTIASRRSNK